MIHQNLPNCNPVSHSNPCGCQIRCFIGILASRVQLFQDVTGKDGTIRESNQEPRAGQAAQGRHRLGLVERQLNLRRLRDHHEIVQFVQQVKGSAVREHNYWG